MKFVTTKRDVRDNINPTRRQQRYMYLWYVQYAGTCVLNTRSVSAQLYMYVLENSHC